MVGIVVVSHSARIGEGVEELARQVTGVEVPLAVAAGIATVLDPDSGDPHQAPGTDPLRIRDAIRAVYSDDGVVVLMDMGSAVLSAEVAVGLLAPEQQDRIFLCEAPLVEGTLAAAVQAAAGSDVQTVLAEACGALTAKAGHLRRRAQAPPDAGTAAEVPGAAGEDADEAVLVLRLPNRLGLHARPAARLVRLAGRFAADLALRCGDGSWVDARRINQVVMLGARQGDEVTFRARGPDARAVLQALQALAGDRFGDPPDAAEATPEPPAPDRPPPESSVDQPAPDVLAGVPASAGIAVGPAAWYRPAPVPVDAGGADLATEEERLWQALTRAEAALDAVHAGVGREPGEAWGTLFDFQRLLLRDPDLVEDALAQIRTEGLSAAAAWQQAAARLAGRYRSVADAYTRARAADVVDAGDRVLRQLAGTSVAPPVFEAPVVLVTPELTPSAAAQLPDGSILGVLTERGGPAGHAAILARARGIPAVVGAGPLQGRVADGQQVALDGGTGRVWLAPTAEAVAALRRRQAGRDRAQAEAVAARHRAAVTRDGVRVEVLANVGRPEEVGPALANGAEGVGLFRTELLFMDRATPPGEAEQYDAYRAAAGALGPRPFVLRTLDAGGDKPVPYLDAGEEAHPFLGWRGLRATLDHPALLKVQLRAMLRAGAGHDLRILFPMVATLAEWRRARALVAQARAELQAEGLPYADACAVGPMIEVPSAVFLAPVLAREADFFSIGTNDLAQFVMAADRGNVRVAERADACQPAVLQAVRQAVEAAHAAGIPASLCGELAADPAATAVLVGLGLDTLSMNAVAVPRVKAAVRGLDRTAAAAASRAALDDHAED